jgi:hypothetical protein
VNPAQPVTPVGTLSVPSTTPAVQNQTITNITVNSSVTQVNPVNPVEALPANSNTVASVANNGFMDPATYSNLCNSLRKESVDNVKMSTAKTFITESNLSSEQVLGIVKLFNFESNRLAFAKWAYSKTVDKKNYIRVYDGLTFSSSKKDLSEYIKNNP